MIPVGSRLRIGEHYPHLRRANVHSGVNGYREYQPTYRSVWQLRDQTAIEACDVEVLPTLVIEIPVADWDGIMEIYLAHWHAQNQNPAVQQAWKEYQLLAKLSQ